MERHLPNGGRARSRLGGEAQGSPTRHELRAFLILAEDLHFGRTAARLGLAQSSLSETIRRLEGKLDSVLLERTSRRVALTDDGRRLLPAAREALNALAAVQTITAPSPAVQSATFRIGIEVPGLVELNRPVLGRFRARNPTTPLVLKEFSCAHGFFEERLDVALVRSPIADERLAVHALATEPRTYMLPRDHPAADAGQASMLDFQDEAFVVLESRAPLARDYWVAREQRGGELPRVGAQAFTAREIADGVLHLGAIAVGLVSGRRMLPEVAFADAIDLPDNTIGLAVRVGDERAIVRDFCEVVRRVLVELADLAPGITPLAPPALVTAGD